MRHALASVLVVFFSVPTAYAARSTQQSPESKVLARWLGTWECRAVVRHAGAPRETRVTEKKTSAWILGGEFVQEIGRSDVPKREYRFLSHYDARAAAFRGWLFTSEGNVSEWTGTWDEKTTTMTWTSDLGVGADARLLYRFVGPDKYECKVTVKNKTGKVVTNGHAEHVRVKQ